VDDSEFPYSTTQSPAEEEMPLFRTTYLTGQKLPIMRALFYEILNDGIETSQRIGPIQGFLTIS